MLPAGTTCSNCGRPESECGPQCMRRKALAAPLTADALTDELIKEAIGVLDTELAVLYAALKIKTGKHAEGMRKGAAEVINLRCAEILNGKLEDDGHIRDCGNGGSDPRDCSPACASARRAR